MKLTEKSATLELAPQLHPLETNVLAHQGPLVVQEMPRAVQACLMNLKMQLHIQAQYRLTPPLHYPIINHHSHQDLKILQENLVLENPR